MQGTLCEVLCIDRNVGEKQVLGWMKILRKWTAVKQSGGPDVAPLLGRQTIDFEHLEISGKAGEMGLLRK